MMSFMEKETSKQNNVEKFEMREPNKNKTEAKWKYKVRQLRLNLVFSATHTLRSFFKVATFEHGMKHGMKMVLIPCELVKERGGLVQKRFTHLRLKQSTEIILWLSHTFCLELIKGCSPSTQLRVFT